jgi:hypothetical protein
MRDWCVEVLALWKRTEFDRVRRELGNSRWELCETLGGEGMNEGVRKNAAGFC